MCSVQGLRAFVTERLTAAAAEILGAFEKTIAEYEEEIERQRRLLDAVWRPEVKLRRLELPKQRVCEQEEILTDPQTCSKERKSRLDEEDPDPPHIKEEQEELFTSPFVLTQETEEAMLIPPNEESGCSKPEPNGDGPTDSGLTDGTETTHRKNTSRTVESSSVSELCRFVCDVCGKGFKKCYRLKFHTQTHTGEKPFPCHMCGKRFREKSKLTIHTRIHTGEKPFPCHMCGKRFREKSKLTIHTWIHTGEKPFPCHTCGKKFSANSKLKRHLIVHTGEKPFSCDTCGKKFKLLSILNSHLKVHTDDKPFLCNVCGKRFHRMTHLKRHMLVHTN